MFVRKLSNQLDSLRLLPSTLEEYRWNQETWVNTTVFVLNEFLLKYRYFGLREAQIKLGQDIQPVCYDNR